MVAPEDIRYVEGYNWKDPWTDVKVREAMSIAIDRQAILDTLYFGAGEILPLPYPMPGYKDLQPIPYDPERAKQLLTDAGFPDGFSFSYVSYPESPNVPTLVEAVVGYWEAIGLKPSIRMTDYAIYKPKHTTGTTAGETYTNVGSFKDDFTITLIRWFTFEGDTPRFQTSELDAMIQRLRGTTDLVKRNELWGEVERYMYDNYITMPLFMILPAFAFNSETVEKVPPALTTHSLNYAYLRHAQPLNTFRLFELDK
jgi:ABC-type transport system substrate-binding protein